MILSSFSHVKRDNTNNRPPAPPIASFTGFTGDRSGSMYTMNGKQYEMTNQMLNEIKSSAEISGIPTYLDFVTFDDIVEIHIDNQLLNESKCLNDVVRM